MMRKFIPALLFLYLSAPFPALSHAGGIVSKQSPIMISGRTSIWSYNCSFPSDHPSSGLLSCEISQTRQIGKFENGKMHIQNVGGIFINFDHNKHTASSPQKTGFTLTLTHVSSAFRQEADPVVMVDGKKLVRLQWDNCHNDYCVATGDLTDAQLTSLQKGQKLILNVGGEVADMYYIADLDKPMAQINSWRERSPFR